MNTRSFIKSLAAIAIAPQVLIPRAVDSCTWGFQTTYYRVNPDWANAHYELKFIERIDGIWVHIRDAKTHRLTGQTVRFKLNRNTGIYDMVPEFVPS